jgi:hypothetical protein
MEKILIIKNQYFFCLIELESTTVKAPSNDKFLIKISFSMILAVSNGSEG